MASLDTTSVLKRIHYCLLPVGSDIILNSVQMVYGDADGNDVLMDWAGPPESDTNNICADDIEGYEFVFGLIHYSTSNVAGFQFFNSANEQHLVPSNLLDNGAPASNEPVDLNGTSAKLVGLYGISGEVSLIESVGFITADVQCA